MMINNSIVCIHKEKGSAGTGFFISAQGHILTCLHVLKEAMRVYDNENEEYIYTYNRQAKHFKAVKIAEDEEKDLAILKVISDLPKNHQYFSLAGDNFVHSSTSVSCYGYPHGSEELLNAGRISILENADPNDVRLQLGNANGIAVGFSGAPLIVDNNVVGIVRSIVPEDEHGKMADFAFAFSHVIIKEFLEKNLSKDQFIDISEHIAFSIDTSKPYIKNKAFSLFPIHHERIDRSIHSLLRYFSSQETIQHWTKINLLFECIASYQKPGNGTGEKIKYVPGSLFQIVADEMVSSNGNPFRFTLKGQPSQGKSLFLTILYCYLLNMYKRGLSKYIPVYYNIETFGPSSLENSYSDVDAFFEGTNSFSQKTGVKLCYILDGFNEYKYREHCVEEYLYQKYIADISASHRLANDNSYVFSIDINDSRHLAATSISNDRSSSRIMYMSSIDIIGSRVNQSDHFVELFCDIMQRGCSKVIQKNIRRLNLPGVDLNLLFHHIDELSVEAITGDTLSSLYNKYYNQVVNRMEREIAIEAAFKIRFCGATYDSFSNKISSNLYELLLRQRELTYYLSARFYLDSIKMNSFGAQNNQNPTDTQRKVLNAFFNNEQNLYINDLIENNYLASDDIARFTQNYYRKLTPSGKSQLIYLLHRAKLYEKMQRIFTKKRDTPAPSEDFYTATAHRSIQVQKARKSKEEMEKYITYLIRTPLARQLNRLVHMFYYGDLTESEVIDAYRVDCVFSGFDIFHTYYVLCDRVRGALNSRTEDDYIYYLDLFTLCDLIQQRIRTPYAKQRKVKNAKTESYFYSPKYNGSSELSANKVLGTMLELVREFHTHYTVLESRIIDVYFKKCADDFQNCMNSFDASDASLKLDRYAYHPSQLYQAVSQLEKKDRTGWKIADIPKQDVSAEKFGELIKDKPSLESVLTHTYQTYLIGLLYLPESLRSNSIYNKQTILNMILIHDLGECMTGDFPPYHPHYQANKIVENDFNNGLFMSGAFTGLADLTDYFELWNNYSDNQSDLNVQIVNELDRIQFLYTYHRLRKEGYFTDFTHARKKQIEEESGKIHTEIGKAILSILVTENPWFKEGNT